MITTHYKVWLVRSNHLAARRQTTVEWAGSPDELQTAVDEQEDPGWELVAARPWGTTEPTWKGGQSNEPWEEQ